MIDNYVRIWRNMMGRRAVHHAVYELLKSRWRTNDFEEVVQKMPWRGCGQYICEAKGLWNTLYDKNITSLVEVGRNLGGGLLLFACMFPNLKSVLSIDIKHWKPTDKEFRRYFDHFGIYSDIVICDSTLYKPRYFYDFVYIDGGHTGPIVEKDINIWKDRCKYIGFHDFADNGKKNKHRIVYQDVVEVIQKYEGIEGWERIGKRGRSEIVFKTRNA